MTCIPAPALTDSALCTHQPIDYPVVKASEMVALNTAVIAADEASAAASTRREQVVARCAALRDRLAAMPAAPPEPEMEQAASLIDALAADPGHAPGEADLAAITQERVATRRAWETQVAEREILRKAIEKVEQEIAGIDGEIAELASERASKWRAFLTAAHPFLMSRFHKQFTALVADTLQVADDLQRLTIEGEALVPYTAWKVDEAEVVLKRHVPTKQHFNGSPSQDSTALQKLTLFETGRGELREPSEAIMRFRDNLG